MVRFLAFTIVAFLLPFVVFGAWRFITAGVVPGREMWSMVIWSRLVAVGALVMLIAIGVLVSVSGNGEKTTYHPAHIENGQLVPGSFD